MQFYSGQLGFLASTEGEKMKPSQTFFLLQFLYLFEIRNLGCCCPEKQPRILGWFLRAASLSCAEGLID